MSQATNPVNEAHKSYRQHANRFPFSYDHFLTARYADATPFFVMEAVEGDSIPLHSNHEIRTHTLGAPLMSQVIMKKDYFHVPLRALLKESFDQFYHQPTQGDDVPENAGTVISIKRLFDILCSPWYNWQFATKGEWISGSDTHASAFIRYIFLCETFFSSGSLLSTLGYKFNEIFHFYGHDDTGTLDPTQVYDFDYWFENYFIPWLGALDPRIRITHTNPDNTTVQKTYKLDTSTANVSADYIVGFRRMVELMRENPEADYLFGNDFSEPAVLAARLFGPHAASNPVSTETFMDLGSNPDYPYFNPARAYAYQLVMAHFYTNDRIDFIYSADLFRKLLRSTYIDARVLDGASLADARSEANGTFDYNGNDIPYDVFSGGFIDTCLFGRLQSHINYYQQLSLPDAGFPLLCSMVQMLFGYRKSLRFGDYFTGSHPTPLAVGEIDTAVSDDNTVSTLNMTRNLLKQRFLNAVNRIGNRLDDYILMLSGKRPRGPVSDPQFLAHTVNGVKGFEVENTAEDQGNIVTLLKSSSGDFAFSFEANEPGIVLGIVTFEAKRIYSNSFERFGIKASRFDMFNKFFQYSGDQQIYGFEHNNRYLGSSLNLGYALRNMEYKQRVSICSGGFKNYLKGYLFITDGADNGQTVIDDVPQFISPDFIRSQNTEFDRFYTSLSHYGLAGYFHFIVKFENECSPSRQMEYAPSML